LSRAPTNPKNEANFQKTNPIAARAVGLNPIESGDHSVARSTAVIARPTTAISGLWPTLPNREQYARMP
jgi:hypothetical protein